MSRDLMALPRPDEVTALREMSLDRLGFLQRCNQQYEGIVPLQLGSPYKREEVENFWVFHQLN